MKRENLPPPTDPAFDHAAAGMLQTDASGRVQRVNRAFAQLLGCTSGSLIGRSLGALACEDDAEAHAALLDALRRGASEQGRIEMRYEPEPDRTVWADVALS